MRVGGLAMRTWFLLAALLLASCSAAPPMPTQPVEPSKSVEPLRVEMLPATAVPTQLIPIGETSLLSLADGALIVSGQFGIDDGDGTSLGDGRTQGIACYARDGSLRWMIKPGEGLATIDLARGIDGGVLVAGSFHGALDLGDGKLHVAFGSDAFVMRLDPATGKATWFWSGTGWAGDWNQVTRMAVDAHGDIFLAGWFKRAVDLGGGFLRSPRWGEGFAAKLSGTNGQLVWSALMPNGGSESVNGVVALPDGDALFVGYEIQGADKIGKEQARALGALLARFSSEGKLRWQKRSGGHALFNPQDAVADGKGGAWIIGNVLGRATLGKSTITAADQGRDAPFVMRVDGKGEPQIVRVFPDASVRASFSRPVAMSDGVAVFGASWGPRTFGKTTLPSFKAPNGSVAPSAFVLRLDARAEPVDVQLLQPMGSLSQALASDGAGGLVAGADSLLPSAAIGRTRAAVSLYRLDGHGPMTSSVLHAPGPTRWVGNPPVLKELASQFVCPPGRVANEQPLQIACRDSKTGQLDGPFWSWRPDGRAKQEGAYAQGKHSGTWRTWIETTAMVLEENYVADKRSGLRRWRRPGLVEMSRSFDTDGKPDGFWADYGEDGSVTKAERYAHGQLMAADSFGPRGTKLGTDRRLNDGTLQVEQFFADGHPQSRGRTDGTVKFRRIGTWTYWYPNGTKACEVEYAPGLATASQYALDGTLMGTLKVTADGASSPTGSPIRANEGDPCQ